jgi:hypothetical protein
MIIIPFLTGRVLNTCTMNARYSYQNKHVHRNTRKSLLSLDATRFWKVLCISIASCTSLPRCRDATRPAGIVFTFCRDACRCHIFDSQSPPVVRSDHRAQQQKRDIHDEVLNISEACPLGLVLICAMRTATLCLTAELDVRKRHTLDFRDPETGSRLARHPR